MAPNVLVPISNGFEEIEACNIVDVLRRAGITVTIAGLTEGLIEGRSKIRLQPDCTIDNLAPATLFDMVVLPGGQPNAKNLGKDKRVLELLRSTHRAGNWIAAICAAPSALAIAGLLDNEKATIYPGNENDIPPGCYKNQDVVISNKIVTSKGPATAMSFALTLVQLLMGETIAQKVSSAILAT